MLQCSIKRIKQIKRRNKLRISILLLFLLFNFFLLYQFFFTRNCLAPHDVDRKSNGNTLISAITLNQMFSHSSRVRDQIPLENNSIHHRIIEINENGKVTWEYYGLAVPHEILELSNGNLLVADTNFDRVIEIDYNTKKIIWSWKPSKINWTKVNPEWGESHYYNNPIVYDWTHLNDVDFKQYGTWNACLVSLRNFDLIVEINYTAELENPNSAENIIWCYGDYLNHSLLYRQHNPDYLSNGNIIVADSTNDRIIEINYTSKEIVWESTLDLKWPRDVDELNNGNFLITDSYNNRIIEINKTTEKIIWNFNKDIMIPYEADLLKNGNILISSEYMGKVLEVNRDGFIVWSYGFSLFNSFFSLNALIILSVCIIEIFYKTRNLSNAELSQGKMILNFSLLGYLIIFAIVSLIIIFHFDGLIQTLLQIIYPNVKHSVL